MLVCVNKCYVRIFLADLVPIPVEASADIFYAFLHVRPNILQQCCKWKHYERFLPRLTTTAPLKRVNLDFDSTGALSATSGWVASLGACSRSVDLGLELKKGIILV
jgi:hypothetical protein